MNKAFDIFNPTEEHQQLRENVRRFAEAEMDGQAASYDEKESFNEALFRKFATQLGLFGLTVSEKDGGAGMDVTASVLVHEELSRFDPALTLSFLAHEVLFVNNFYHCSNEQQRERYLGKVIDGTWIAGMAMTEPEAGTDVLAMRTRALRKGDRFVLNGTKQFITNGPYGNVFLVYAKTGDGPKDVSAFVVESSFAGFSVGKKESKMGMRASPTSCLVFEDMEVPASNLLGSEGGALVHMMRNLEIERLTLAAQSVGIALRCCDVMTQYAVAERKAFGQPLAEFGQIQRLLSESYAHTQAARALVYATALRISPEHRESLGAAASKLVATTIGETVARNAIQVLGGYGYTRDYPVERLLRDAILLSIGGGTNEAMQKNITRDLARAYR
ncbi:MAG TPA: acyl-CoA dehydrogenase family protein [Polyangiaceae bacterium]|jgi:isovaleryl-CoA dehydrogenase|nr:MAG: Acyl-CoA dehydrogenase [Deltaproteobacteria bacterium ADurb.Bin207]HNS96176.1 acyl-CoA dehydrogenase family protein [Polyangiaceae bacterium]HNZ22601.1 acyl-CoA dehydrogenase family protein [Polyangiaceae bacterium]HOD25461.1 acyl-CoA dehydrogenase family protein [Polyangiaceae bacterium]HOE48400.1 acyl-CoA dehydrogenase family protein [Polyangiaceae bacterium]